MKRISLFISKISLFIFTSCGQNSIEKKSAPRTQSEAGIIVSCVSTELAKSIAYNHKLNYRVLSHQRKIVEFIGTDKKELKQLLNKSLKNNVHYRLISNKIYGPPLARLKTKHIVGPRKIEDVPYYGAFQKKTMAHTERNLYFPHLDQINARDLDPIVQTSSAIIAIIDTGVYYNHPHIRANIRTNDLEIAGNGLDDDGNGYIDDKYGYDFYNGDAYPIDDNGHGTHVAGLSSGSYAGVAPHSQVLPIKVLDRDGRGDLGTIIAGISYAIDSGVDIINLSLGGEVKEFTQDLKKMEGLFKVAQEKGILIISAAGNGGSDGLGDCNDITPVYPANIKTQNSLSVASVNADNVLADYSNFGGSSVHIAAPGGSWDYGGLLSLAIPFCSGPCSEQDAVYTKNLGTSMAAPLVSGLAALLKAKNLKTMDIINIILKSSQKIKALEGLVFSSGVIDVKSALDLANEVSP